MTPEGAAEIEINKEMWKDPDIWGTLLADVAVSIAEGYSTEDRLGTFVADLEKSFSRDIWDAINSR